MANLKGSLQDLDKASFALDKNTEVCRRTCDDETHDLLTDIVNNTGGGGTTLPTVFNKAVPTDATEESQVLPTNTSGYIVRTRGRSELQLAWVSTESATKYVTIRGNAVFEDKNFYSSAITLFFQTAAGSAADTVEIVAFT